MKELARAQAEARSQLDFDTGIPKDVLRRMKAEAREAAKLQKEIDRQLLADQKALARELAAVDRFRAAEKRRLAREMAALARDMARQEKELAREREREEKALARDREVYAKEYARALKEQQKVDREIFESSGRNAARQICHRFNRRFPRCGQTDRQRVGPAVDEPDRPGCGGVGRRVRFRCSLSPPVRPCSAPVASSSAPC